MPTTTQIKTMLRKLGVEKLPKTMLIRLNWQEGKLRVNQLTKECLAQP
jgi:hypothetical protein